MSFLQRLRTDAWRTSGARYNAARRLRRRSLFSTASLAFFSASTVVLALIQSSSSGILGSPELSRYLTLLSGCVGVFLLAISLIEWGARSSEKADNLHRNAEALNGFQRRLGVIIERDAIAGNVESELREQARYDEIKATCFDNHDPIDDELFVSSHRLSPEFVGDKKAQHGRRWATWIVIRHYWASTWYFLCCWLIFIALVVKAPW